MPLTLSVDEWEACLVRVGLENPSARTAHLKALTAALGRHREETQRKGTAPITGVLQAFRAWDETRHPFEQRVVRPTPEYARLTRELADSTPPPHSPALVPVADKMLIALWNCPHGPAWHALDHGERHTQLDAVLAHVRNRLAAIPAEERTKGAVQAILAAPEYQYTAKASERFPMGEARKVHVENELRQKSEANPTILLAAGTSHYMKRLRRSAGAAAFKVDPVTGLRDRAKVGISRRWRATCKLSDAMQNARVLGNPGWVNAGHVEYWTGTNVPRITIPALEKLDDVISDQISDPLVVRNVAYLFLRGSRVAAYDKQADWGEALSMAPDYMMFIPGTEKQCPEIGERRYGVEICYDHFVGALSRRNPGELHFHIVLSDSVKTVQNHMAMSDGGYFVHASTALGETCVYRRPPQGRPVRLVPDDFLAFGAGRLDFYVVTEPRAGFAKPTTARATTVRSPAPKTGAAVSI